MPFSGMYFSFLRHPKKLFFGNSLLQFPFPSPRECPPMHSGRNFDGTVTRLAAMGLSLTVVQRQGRCASNLFRKDPRWVWSGKLCREGSMDRSQPGQWARSGGKDPGSLLFFLSGGLTAGSRVWEWQPLAKIIGAWAG